MYSLHNVLFFFCLIFCVFAFYVLCLFLITTSFLVNNGEYIMYYDRLRRCDNAFLHFNTSVTDKLPEKNN